MTKSQAINLCRYAITLPKDKGEAFISYYGHTSNIYCQVHVPNWDSNKEPTHSFAGNIDGHMSEDVEAFIKEALQ